MADTKPVASYIQPFIDAGIVPPGCRRVIVDFQAGDVVRVYYEILGDQRVIDVMGKLVENNTIPRLPKELRDVSR